MNSQVKKYPCGQEKIYRDNLVLIEKRNETEVGSFLLQGMESYELNLSFS